MRCATANIEQIRARYRGTVTFPLDVRVVLLDERLGSGRRANRGRRSGPRTVGNARLAFVEPQDAVVRHGPESGFVAHALHTGRPGSFSTSRPKAK